MRRLLAGLAIGALIFGVGFAGAKVANVTNPMSADLAGANHNINDVANYQTSDGAILGGTSSLVVEANVVNQLPSFTVVVSYKAGAADPSLTCLDVNAGSVYSQQIGGFGGTGVLWFKTGPNPCDWHRVTLAP